MTVTAANYEKAKAYAGREGLSEPVRRKLLEELSAYEGGFQKSAGGSAPEEPYSVIQGQAPTEASLVDGLKKKLDPALPLRAQALATQPATTHPDGDEAAADEWMRQTPGATGSPVIVYDMPMAKVRQKLLEHPELIPTISHSDFIPHPQDILNLTPDSALAKSVQDYYWRETADAAAKSGRSAYRYSKAPWLQDGSLGGAVQSLGLKLGAAGVPAFEGLSAFVMGEDDTANFGAARAAQESGLGNSLTDIQSSGPREPEPPEVTAKLGKGREIHGGVLETADTEGLGASETNDMLAEEHPNLYRAGQIAGIAPGLVKGAAAKVAGLVSETAEQGIRALRPWTASNALWDTIQEAAAGITKKAPQTGLPGAIVKTGAGAVGGAAAGAVDQVAREGVRAAASLAQGDPTPGVEDLEAAGGRVLEAGKSGGKFGAYGGAAQAVAGGVGNWVREGQRYKGLPGKLERAGVQPEFGRGYRTPADVKAAAAEAQKTGDTAEEVLAERVAPKIREASANNASETYAKTKGENEAFHPSAEGQAPLRVNEFHKTALKQLRGDTERRVPEARAGRGEVPDAVGTPDKGAATKKLWNQELDDVTIKPTRGAVELTPEEAQSFLDEKNQVLLRRSTRSEKAPPLPTKPAPNGAPALSPPETIERGSAPGRAASPARATPGAPDSVPGVPSKREPVREGPRYGTKNALPGRRPPAPEAPKKPPVRVTGEGRASKPPERPKGLAGELRAQGYDRVYVVPRAHSAEHTETLLDSIGAYRGKNGTLDRDVAELDKAVRRDRDARPMDGRPGGWSKFKNRQSKDIKAAQTMEKHVAPGGEHDTGNDSVVGFARKPSRQRDKSLRAAADKAGPDVRRDLERTRVPVLLDKFDKLNSFTAKRSGDGLFSFVPRAFDAGNIRFAYPAIKALEGPLGAVGMGAAGRAAVIDDEQDRERRKASSRTASEGYAERRQAVVDEQTKKRLPKKKRRSTQKRRHR